MPRYVITGASGHIGNNLVRIINELEPDSPVIALTRRTVGKELNGTVCKQVVGDLGSREFLEENISEGDIVMHLAGIIDLSNTMPEETDRVNHIGTRLICDVCLKKKVGRFIYFGSVDGVAKSGGTIESPDEYYPKRIEGNYGQSKARAAQYVTESIKAHPDFNAAILLPSAVIGINDHKPSAVGKVISDTLAGKAEFGIRGGYNFVDVRDVCLAALSLCRSDARGSFIISGHSVSVSELYGAINRARGFRRKPLLIPLPLVKIFMPFIKVLNPITLKALTEEHNYSYKKAELVLGYTPRPCEETLEDTLAWFENEAGK